MKIFVIALIVAVLAYLIFEGVRTYRYIQISKVLVDAAVPYVRTSASDTPSMLVLGDSTAVGVGAARPEESLAGLVAVRIDAGAVENYSRSGAVTQELPRQIARAERDAYTLVLIQIGGNDIIRFKKPEAAADELSRALAALPKSEKVIVISAGNVGGAPLLPFFLRPFYTRENVAYHAAFERVTEAAGYTYVNLYEAKNGKVIENDPKTYLAADGLHPSSAGYAVWFEAIEPALAEVGRGVETGR